MYHLDPNLNNAVERQFARMQAVRAFQTNSSPRLATPVVLPMQNQTNSHPNRITAKATLAFMAAAPIALVLAWALATR